MQPLDPLHLPLQGRRLLEASAGTGKTYTLALLFLRLLLEQEVPVERILVVTFTRAATGELRDRIRKRLREALLALDAQTTDDELLRTLLARVEQDQARQRLGDALVRMDEAAIHTIHGFCQRILREHAFESATSFTVELMESDLPLKRQVMEDFWRNRFYPASDGEAAWALATWGDPQGLLAALGPAMAGECRLIPEVAPETVEEFAAQARAAFTDMQRLLRQDRAEVEHILQTNDCLKRDDRSYRLSDRVPELCQAMEELARATAMPHVLAKGVDRLAWPVMAGLLKAKIKAKKNAQSPEHPFFHAIDVFLTAHRQFMQALRCLVLIQARDFLHHGLAQRKQQSGLIAYDDLLHQLDAALARSGSGERLTAHLRNRYPVALVDEFQDTDPVQYRLFSRIYQEEEKTTLCMIGDPKQAIYSFRGADIFTYMQARQQTVPAQRYTMAVNYRSTPDMVRAVNTLFGLRPDPFVFPAITFQPVDAAPGMATPLLLDGHAMPPLTSLLLDHDQLKKPKKTTISKETAQQASVRFCADQIVRLLEAGDQGRATIDGRGLTTADIAILVRTHREAEAMQAGLRLRGLASLSLGQHSVFADEEAEQLALVLAALVDPGDSGRVRACLATGLFGCNGATIHGLREDEPAWAERLAALHQYRRLWQEQGFMVMFQQLLAREGVTRRLTGCIGGERSLTNFLHLAELLQHSPMAGHGAPALLRWFRRQIDNPDHASEAQLVRLESDARLIRIVTVHRAKGLEFPVVVLPFLWNGRKPDKEEPLQFHERDRFRLTIDLGSGLDDHRCWAEEERLAEELRLLYVAVTRAKSCCLFCWGLVSGLELTGMAHLLHQGRCPVDEAALRADMDRLNAETILVEQRSFPDTFATHRFSRPEERVKLHTRHFTGRILPGWTMTSYSRLSSDGPGPIDERDSGESAVFTVPAEEDFCSPFTFPRGPAAGTCLHSLLEQMECNRPAKAQQPLIAEVLEQAGIDLRWLDAVCRWLDDVLAVELPGACALGQVRREDRITELNFLFPLEQMNMRRFAALLEAAGFRAPAVSMPTIQGLMKGFIDLVFRYQGRYCIVDYKSNYLGPTPTDYGAEALAACMDSHQYHLQLLIYTLALHRFLGARLPGYDYQHHMGGGYYLFLRAMGPHLPPASGIHTMLPEAGLILALDGCCRGEC